MLNLKENGEITHKDLSNLLRSDINSYVQKLIESNEVKKESVPRYLSEKLNIHRTISYRILGDKPFRADFELIVKFYSLVHETNDIEKLITIIPDWARTFLQKKTQSEVDFKYITQDANIHDIVFSNNENLDLYVFISPYGQKMSDIRAEFGNAGVRRAEDMLSKGAIILRDDFVQWNPQKSIINNAHTHKKFSSSLINLFFDPESTQISGENIMSFRIKEVSQKSYKKIINKFTQLKIEIDQIIEIDKITSKDDDEKVKFFSVATVDKIDRHYGKAIDFKRS